MNTLTKTRLRNISSENDPLKGAGSAGFQYPQLNGLRFVFIFLVLLHHWGPQKIFEQYRTGWLGVDLFFVLSGFLIGEILLLEKAKTRSRLGSIKNFVMRRVLRIFPLYYLVILLFSLLVTSGGILVWNLTYTNNILQAIDLEKVPEEFWHLWSLCVEEQFYLFFPFFVFFVGKKWIPVFLGIGIVGSVVGRFLATAVYHNTPAYALMPLCLDSLFMGVLLAYFKTFHVQRLQSFFQKKRLIAGGILLATLCLFLLCYKQNELFIYSFFRLSGSVLGFFVIGFSVMVCYRGTIKLFLENRFIAYLGKISYGLYLVHPFVEKIYYTYTAKNAVRNFLISLNQPLISNRYLIDFIFLFTATVAISYLSFEYFEKRFLKLKRLYS